MKWIARRARFRYENIVMSATTVSRPLQFSRNLATSQPLVPLSVVFLGRYIAELLPITPYVPDWHVT